MIYNIKVPATTANLGSGFDSFGIAFNLYNIFSVEESNKFEFQNIDKQFANEDNLFIYSYKYLLKAFDRQIKGIKLKIETNIPICRGLGSSSTLIVGGLMTGNILYDLKLNKEEILHFATKIEGHPDNVAPAIFGGMQICVSANEKIHTFPIKISNNVKFCGLVPNFELATEQARGILPKQVLFSDAVFNASRSAFLIKALESGDIEKIKIGIEDKIHQQYRKTLIKDFDEIEKIVKNNNGCICISGAGSTLLAIYQENDFLKNISPFINALKNWQIIDFKIDNEGAVSF